MPSRRAPFIIASTNNPNHPKKYFRIIFTVPS
jgi:hypothetical protein